MHATLCTHLHSPLPHPLPRKNVCMKPWLCPFLTAWSVGYQLYRCANSLAKLEDIFDLLWRLFSLAWWVIGCTGTRLDCTLVHVPHHMYVIVLGSVGWAWMSELYVLSQLFYSELGVYRAFVDSGSMHSWQSVKLTVTCCGGKMNIRRRGESESSGWRDRRGKEGAVTQYHLLVITTSLLPPPPIPLSNTSFNGKDSLTSLS